MDSADIQRDPRHPTGRVVVEVIDREPRYHIVPDCAYDFIEVEQIRPASSAGLLYHGTLGVRNDVSRKALLQLTQNPALTIFLDVNLRTPWWDREEVFFWLKRARWVKLNEEELRLLGFIAADLEEELFIMRNRFQLEQIILTRGGEGVLVCTAEDRLHEARPAKVPHFVDSVGAGDAFSAVYIHGLLSSWSLEQTVDAAQRFAAMIIGRRGATVTDPAFYQQFSDALGI
jgi:fructokinase